MAWITPFEASTSVIMTVEVFPFSSVRITFPSSIEAISVKNHHLYNGKKLMQAKAIRIEASLRLRWQHIDGTLSNDGANGLRLHLEKLPKFTLLPAGKTKMISLMRRFSQLTDQKITMVIGDKDWISFQQGRIAVHNFSLSLRAIFS